LMDGAAAPGTHEPYTRGDHVHPTDTTRAPLNSPTFTGALTAVNFTVTGNSHIAGAASAASLNVSGASTLKGVTATSMTISGTLTLAGPIVANAVKGGHLLGTYAGPYPPTGPLALSDANIILYDGAGTNWCGMGTTSGGDLWIRTGLSGTPGAAMYIDQSVITHFLNSPTIPQAAGGDNSNKLASTAFVNANMAVGSYLPLAGGTINGNLTVAGGDLYARRGDNTGVLFLNSAQTRYLYWDAGSNYSLVSAPAIAGNGRLWGTGDFASAPVSTGRLVYVGDYMHDQNTTTIVEPYGGAVATGASGPSFYNGATYGNLMRYRYFQLYTTSWFTIGYV
jgi:hypothetical protein